MEAGCRVTQSEANLNGIFGGHYQSNQKTIAKLDSLCKNIMSAKAFSLHNQWCRIKSTYLAL